MFINSQTHIALCIFEPQGSNGVWIMVILFSIQVGKGVAKGTLNKLDCSQQLKLKEKKRWISMGVKGIGWLHGWIQK
jgi:hypothetical protein